MSDEKQCHHAWGEWVPLNDETEIRHCVICTARQSRPIKTVLLTADPDE
jgi:hypothetical protein